MSDQPIRILSNPSANDLQHAYAGHIFRLRGYLPNNNAMQPTREDKFSLEQYHVQAGQEVGVKNELPSPPVLAHINHEPLTIKSSVNPSNHMVRVSLVLPQRAPSGPVSLVWPSKTLTSDRDLIVTTHVFDLEHGEAAAGGDFYVGLFPVKPSEVFIGETPLKPTDVRWQNAALQVRLPENASSGTVLVVASPDVFQSRQPLVVSRQGKSTALPPAR